MSPEEAALRSISIKGHHLWPNHISGLLALPWCSMERISTALNLTLEAVRKNEIKNRSGNPIPYFCAVLKNETSSPGETALEAADRLKPLRAKAKVRKARAWAASKGDQLRTLAERRVEDLELGTATQRATGNCLRMLLNQGKMDSLLWVEEFHAMMLDEQSPPLIRPAPPLAPAPAQPATVTTPKPFAPGPVVDPAKVAAVIAQLRKEKTNEPV